MQQLQQRRQLLLKVIIIIISIQTATKALDDDERLMLQLLQLVHMSLVDHTAALGIPAS